MNYSYYQNSKSDILKLQQFIKNYYKKKIIFFHGQKKYLIFILIFTKKKINFISQKKYKKIISIFGFVPNSNWDYRLKKDVYLGWWQNKNKNNNGLLNLIYFLKKDWKSIYSMGLTKENSIKIVNFLDGSLII